MSAEEELLDVLDQHGEPTGEVKPRDAVHRDGDPHRAAHLWVRSGEHVLLQRRAATKAAWPGKLDATAAGHVGAGEDVLDALLREAEEELGTRWAPGDVRVLGTWALDDRPGPGLVNREHQLVAVVRDDRPLEDWAPGLDAVELEGLVALGLPALAELAADSHAGPWLARAVGTDGKVSDVVVRADEVLRPAYLTTLAEAL